MRSTSAGDAEYDDLPDMFATPAKELAFWLTHTIDARRSGLLEPLKIERHEPDLRVAPREPLPDLFDYLTYEEWREGIRQNPTLYWDPYLGVQRLIGRS